MYSGKELLNLTHFTRFMLYIRINKKRKDDTTILDECMRQKCVIQQKWQQCETWRVTI